MTIPPIANELIIPSGGVQSHPALERGHRFTLDGDDRLELQLADTCANVLDAVREIVPPKRLEAVVLGGGYGRGEGGVLKTRGQDRPYNDLEFYVFVHGNRFWSEHSFGPKLAELGERLSPGAGLHVEFKVDSLEHFRRSPVTMYSYDLVSGHLVLFGESPIFAGCDQHADARNIPLCEATRLLMNRCTGLLLARNKLLQPEISEAGFDFIQRNIAKAQLALGDALLTVLGEYHWSCLERFGRLRRRVAFPAPDWLAEVRGHHAAGIAFKLHPGKPALRRPASESQLKEVAGLALEVWLWLESRRLGCRFESARQYGLSPLNKWPEASGWRSLLINLRRFGPAVVLGKDWYRHPRGTALSMLALLLWDPGAIGPEIERQLAEKTHLPFHNSADLMGLYERLWRKVN